MRQKGNGLVELVDEKHGLDANEWCCMHFHLFSFDEKDKSWEASHARYLQAKSGNCPYRDICPKYERTMKKIAKQPVQLNLF